MKSRQMPLPEDDQAAALVKLAEVWRALDNVEKALAEARNRLTEAKLVFRDPS
jgi:hypothetical protein